MGNITTRFTRYSLTTYSRSTAVIITGILTMILRRFTGRIDRVIHHIPKGTLVLSKVLSRRCTSIGTTCRGCNTARIRDMLVNR